MSQKLGKSRRFAASFALAGLAAVTSLTVSPAGASAPTVKEPRHRLVHGSATSVQGVSAVLPQGTPARRSSALPIVHKTTENDAAEGAVAGTLSAPLSVAPPQVLPQAQTLSDPSPGFTTNFQGTMTNFNDPSSYIPPDTHGAVGPNHVITATNNRIVIHDKATGAVVNYYFNYPNAARGFWQSLSPAGATDPRFVFDPFIAGGGRWIATVSGDFSTTTPKIFLAISKTSSPLDGWWMYKLSYPTNDTVNNPFCDYPSLGYNKDWITISCNLFGDNDSWSRLHVFHIANVITGAPDTALTYNWPASEGHTIAPAETFDPTLNTVYFVGSFMGQDPADDSGWLKMYSLTGSVSSPTLDVTGTLAHTADGWGPEGQPQTDFEPQAGDAHLINAGDDRIQKVVYRNGSLWATQTAFLPPYARDTDPAVTATYSGVQWWQLDPGAATGANIIQQGRIQDPTATQAQGEMYAFPSIAVNKNNDVLVGFSRFSRNHYAQAAYAFRYASDPANSMRTDRVLKDGLAPYWASGLDPIQRNRWGDYSTAVVDPANDTDFWTEQEYAEAPDASFICAPSGRCDRFGTWWGRVPVSAPATIPGAPSSLNGSPGDNKVNLSWNAPASDGGSAVTSYKVYRGTTSGGETFLATSPATAYTDNTAVNGTTYYYKVSAVNAVGEGPQSNETSATPAHVLLPPSAPTGLSATGALNRVNLSWSAPASSGSSPIGDYKVYRSTSSNTETFLANVGSTATTFSDLTAVGGNTYFYKVSAVSPDGEGPLSAEASATAVAPTVPGAPTALSAVAGNLQVSLSWTAPASNGGSPITTYRILRGTSAGTETFLADTGSTTTTFVDGTVDNGTQYFYKVAAVNAVGASVGSNEVSASPSAPPVAPGFVNYLDPAGHNGAEPSLGVSPSTGNVLYQAGFETLRVSVDASGNATWRDVSVPTFQNTPVSDPIGFLDPQTGRYFGGEILGNCSQLGFTDDEGKTWTRSQGCGAGNGADHETVGGGPFPPGITPTSSYPNAVWYCAQYVAGSACSLSTDGGLTFGPSTPVFKGGLVVGSGGPTGALCGGIHGHIRVAPSTSTLVPPGTAFIPNRECTVNHQQGGAYSTDGVTWTGFGIGGTSAANFDPSAAFAKDGTLYYGLCNGDGSPMATVSRNLSGTAPTFSTPINVGIGAGPGGANIRNCEFAEMIAADANRAAFAFLGSTTAGDDQVAGFGGSWHLYVSYTYDGGLTWQTVNATPNDPVQKGCIWAGGGNDHCRNLLDFNDIAIDNSGHVVVAYTDGCVNTCVTGGPNSSTAVSAIAYQRTGRPLIAAHDLAYGAPAAPAVTAYGNTASIALTWAPPSDGNRPITSYKIYRGTAPGTEALYATTSDATPRFTDSAVTGGTTYYYTVRGVNGSGIGAQSAETSAATAPDGVPPTAPGAVTVTNNKGGKLGLSWGAATDGVFVDHYEVRRNGALVGNPIGTTFSDSGLTNGSTYTYDVKAVDGSGNASPAASASGIPTELAYGTFVAADALNDQVNGGARFDIAGVMFGRDPVVAGEPAPPLRMFLMMRDIPQTQGLQGGCDATAGSNCPLYIIRWALASSPQNTQQVQLTMNPDGSFGLDNGGGAPCYYFPDPGASFHQAACTSHGNVIEVQISSHMMPTPLSDGDIISAISASVLDPTQATTWDRAPNSCPTGSTPGCGTATWTVGSPASNEAPTFPAIADKTGAEGSLLSFALGATHPRATVSYTMAGAPAGATLNQATGMFSWTPDYTQAGTYTVTFTASTGPGTSSTQRTAKLTIANTDRAPVIAPIGNQTVQAFHALSFTVTATDADGDAVTYSASNLPAGSTFNAATHTFSWTPTTSNIGSYPNVRFSATAGGITTNQDITITVTSDGVPVLSPSPSNLSFGSVAVGTSSSPQTVTVTNTGAGTLSIGTVSIAGTNANDYIKSGDGCSNTHIAPAGTCAVQVAFRPLTGGARAASLSFASDASGSPQLVALSGTGVGQAKISLSPTSLNFGSLAPGTTSAAKRVTVSNPGTAPNGPLTASVTGAGYAIVADACSGSSLPAGGTCAIDVTFTPASGGQVNGSLSVASSLPTASVALTGLGDDQPPVSHFNTANGSILVQGVQSVTGQSVDASGPASATITITYLSGDSASAPLTLHCTSATTCSWAYTIPITAVPGPAMVTVNAIDSLGNSEMSGPAITIVIV